MKKQSGFTLIELLLVLAIIGIISAIAIPALLSQRARARDKAAVQNTDSCVADMVGQWDKFRELGSTPANCVLQVTSYMKAVHANDKNPWNTAVAAYAPITSVAGNKTASEFNGAMALGNMGSTMVYMQVPSSTTGGFCGGAVLLNNKVNGSTAYKKSTAIE